jgi:hypothetical protein
MFISHLLSRFVSFVFIFSLINSIPSLRCAEESYKIRMGSLDCTGLASCAITKCPDLPFCIQKRDGDFWISCKRESCSEFPADKIGQIMTFSDYNCIKTPIPFFYDFQEALTPFVPGMAVFDCATLGSTYAIVNAMRQGKNIPIKRVFAYACIGGLCGLSWLLTNDNQLDNNILYALGAPLATSVAYEYLRK